MKNIIRQYKAKLPNSNEKVDLEIEVLNVPESLEELQADYESDRILDFIVKQVIAHSCFSCARSYFTDHEGKKSLAQWSFELPSKRKPSKSKQLEDENATLKAENLQKDAFIEDLKRRLAESQKQLAKRMKK